MPASSKIDVGHAATYRSIVAMLAAQAVFTFNDTCMKLVTEVLPLGETLVLRNAIAAAGILMFAAVRGGLLWPEEVLRSRAFSWRLVGEVASTILFFSALARMPIGDITGICQITPLAITAAGAVLLGEKAGWRHWIAAIVGFLGVLLIVQPGTTTFTWAAVLAIGANAFGVVRDLATRVIGPTISTLTLTISSVFAVLLSGFALAPFETWQWPGLRELAIMLFGSGCLALGYVLLIASLRMGDLATVSPFRYSSIVWAVLAGYVLWGDIPKATPALGIVIVVAAGLYALHQERLARRQSVKSDA